MPGIHWYVVRKVIRYIIGTETCGLIIKKYHVVLEGFCDVDWNTLSGDSYSTICMFLL